MFITFEGGEGSGKSTHAQRLKTYLTEKGYNVLLTREPGGTQVGKGLRELLLEPEVTLEALTEIFLFAADRSEHVGKIIRPALLAGKIVVSDRYIDSTIAYQVGGRGLPREVVNYLNQTSSQGLMPDLTFLLDVSPEIGVRRAAAKSKTEDRFEKEDLRFHAAVRETYLKIASEAPLRVKVVNTDEKNVDAVQEVIRKIADEYLK
jgi:dTMP kinase